MITLQRLPSSLCIAIDGRLDTPGSAEFDRLVRPALEAERFAIVDFSACAYLSSTGIRSLLLQALRDLHARNIPIITLCSGAFVAGNAGLLDGRHCAIHFTTRDEFRLRFPKAIPVIDKTYIKDGGIISCPGGTAIDLAADLIRQHCGLVRSQKVLKYLLVDEVPTPKAKHKTPLSEPDVYENPLVTKVIEFMKHHLDSPVPLAEVADFAGVTFRQLNLIFTQCTGHSAAFYWRRMRLEQARKLMADSSNSINAIATATGFADASHLIAWFRKQYGETPSSFRKRRREVEKRVKE